MRGRSNGRPVPHPRNITSKPCRRCAAPGRCGTSRIPREDARDPLQHSEARDCGLHRFGSGFLHLSDRGLHLLLRRDCAWSQCVDQPGSRAHAYFHDLSHRQQRYFVDGRAASRRARAVRVPDVADRDDRAWRGFHLRPNAGIYRADLEEHHAGAQFIRRDILYAHRLSRFSRAMRVAGALCGADPQFDSHGRREGDLRARRSFDVLALRRRGLDCDLQPGVSDGVVMSFGAFAISAWDWKPSVLAGCAALAAAYFATERLRFPRRAAAWAGGVLLLLLALVSPLDALADTYLFSAHMAKHIGLVLVIPALLLMGCPPVWIERLLS